MTYEYLVMRATGSCLDAAQCQQYLTERGACGGQLFLADSAAGAVSQSSGEVCSTCLHQALQSGSDGTQAIKRHAITAINHIISETLVKNIKHIYK